MAYVRFEHIPVGQPFYPRTIVLTRELIAQYKEVTGYSNCAYENDLQYSVVLPTLASLFLFQSFHDTFPSAPGRLHVSVDFEFLRPLRQGMILNIGGHVVDKYIKRGKKYLLFEVGFSDDRGLEITRTSIEEVTPE